MRGMLIGNTKGLAERDGRASLPGAAAVDLHDEMVSEHSAMSQVPIGERAGGERREDADPSVPDRYPRVT